MCLTNYLFVAAAALLATCEAISAATESAQSSVKRSTSPPGIEQLIDAVYDGKRFLRTTKTEKYEVDNDDDDDDDDDDGDDDSYDVDEESGNPTKLSTMISPDAVQSIDVVHDSKRFLRTTKAEK
ncbi:hypothetical protein BBI17_008021 [Phytophthora kernoviae]|nr:hypothetical protein BBI17_008021 [Phytophthora kernoviae]